MITKIFPRTGQKFTAHENSPPPEKYLLYGICTCRVHTCICIIHPSCVVVSTPLSLQPPQLSKKEIEELLKKGAYGALMEGDDDANRLNLPPSLSLPPSLPLASPLPSTIHHTLPPSLPILSSPPPSPLFPTDSARRTLIRSWKREPTWSNWRARGKAPPSPRPASSPMSHLTSTSMTRTSGRSGQRKLSWTLMSWLTRYMYMYMYVYMYNHVHSA